MVGNCVEKYKKHLYMSVIWWYDQCAHKCVYICSNISVLIMFCVLFTGLAIQNRNKTVVADTHSSSERQKLPLREAEMSLRGCV